MRQLLLTGLLAAYATGASADVATGSDAMMHRMWRAQKGDTIDTVQQVYSRVVTLKLPRPFVQVTRDERRGFFITEYVPDGETVDNWSRMITVTGTLGMGATRFSDTELAAQFEPKGCPGKVFRDLGPAAPLLGVTGRVVVIGCGPPDQPGAERGVIALYRDRQNSWTVQYAERNHGKPPFSPEQAVARLNALAPAIIPRAPDTNGAPR